jgi:hypothetical protein
VATTTGVRPGTSRFTDELRAGEHEQRKKSVTALQDWLPIRPFDPRNHVKAFICALRGVTAEDTDEVVVEPTVSRRGVERC